MPHRVACLCLALCLALAGCDSDAPGDVDSGTRPGMDSGMMSMADSGSPGTDSGSPASDSGTVGDDGGSTGTDGGSTASDGGSTASDGGGTGSGACTNSADTAALATIDVAMQAETCGRRCFGGSRCVRDCMIMAAGISTECATCFGDTANCTSRNCALRCAGGDTPECTTCRMEAGCITAFETCSGLSGTST